MPDILANINQLRERLSREGKDYVLESILPAQKVYTKFEGTFEGRVVVWNACIHTLASYALTHDVDNDPKQFLDIRFINGAYEIEIGLNLAEIDKAAVERTIIMVRKYKRLHLGRHEYGAKSKTD